MNGEPKAMMDGFMITPNLWNILQMYSYDIHTTKHAPTPKPRARDWMQTETHRREICWDDNYYIKPIYAIATQVREHDLDGKSHYQLQIRHYDINDEWLRTWELG